MIQFMEMVAKNLDSVIETSIDKLFDLLLEIFVLLRSARPRFFHNDDEEIATRLSTGRARGPWPEV